MLQLSVAEICFGVPERLSNGGSHSAVDAATAGHNVCVGGTVSCGKCPFSAGQTEYPLDKYEAKHVKSLLAFASDRRGVTALEYAMIAGIIVVVIAVGFGVYAGDLSDKFNFIGGGV